MSGTTHWIAGACAGVLLAGALPAQSLGKDVLLVSGCILGSLLPDLDNPHSLLSHKFPLLLFLVHAGQSLLRGISRMVPGGAGGRIRSMAGHRGLTHSLLLPGLFFFGGCCGSSLALGVALGTVSHLILDLLSGGVPLFLPVWSGRIGVRMIKTGGFVDTVLIRTLLFSGCIWQLIKGMG